MRIAVGPDEAEGGAAGAEFADAHHSDAVGRTRRPHQHLLVQLHAPQTQGQLSMLYSPASRKLVCKTKITLKHNTFPHPMGNAKRRQA